jgi:hypothetical protein
MWRRVVLVWTDVSEERIASIFRVEQSASEEPAWAGAAGFSTLKIEASDELFKQSLNKTHNKHKKESVIASGQVEGKVKLSLC